MTILTKNRCNIIFGLDKVLTVDNEIRKFLWNAKLKKRLEKSGFRNIDNKYY